MNCQQIQSELALLAGRDLSDSARCQALNDHLSNCPGCQTRFAKVTAVLGVLQRANESSTFVAGAPHLWPAISRRLAAKPKPGLASLWGFLPMVSAVAACGLLLMLARPHGDNKPLEKSVAPDLTPDWSKDPKTPRQHKNVPKLPTP